MRFRIEYSSGYPKTLESGSKTMCTRATCVQVFINYKTLEANLGPARDNQGLLVGTKTTNKRCSVNVPDTALILDINKEYGSTDP